MRWVSEQEYRQSGAESTGVTLNVAFLMEIKTDFGFRELLNEAYRQLKPRDIHQVIPPRIAADLLSDLRDEMETYFTLEECYGYFSEAAVQNPQVCQQAVELKSEHEALYIRLSELVEIAQQIVYRECGPEFNVSMLADEFEEFCKVLADHEQAEMELMMQLCNEEIGVGD